MSKGKTECVKVAVRCRPISSQEKIDNRQIIVSVDEGRGQIQVKNMKDEGQDNVKAYTFDVVIAPNAKQEEVYTKTALPVIESVLQGYNGTIFAYGQTGTGKTFTMEGIYDNPSTMGIIPRSFGHIFHCIEGTPDTKFLVFASYLELYNEQVRDLLSKNYKQELQLKEAPDKSVYVKNLSQFKINNIEDLHKKLEDGKANRQVAKTDMNNDSSRSHSIFMITVEMATAYAEGKTRICVGKLNLVDLAGSERQDKTHAVGERLKEAITINQSLSTLGNVISALVDQKDFIPYRNSKLTRLLQDSLGGNTKTVMIANIGPVDYNYDETINTLRYANRAKNIKNKPHINEDPKDAKIRQFQEEINRLKQELEKQLIVVNPDGTITRYEEEVIVKKVEDTQKIEALKNKMRREKETLEQQFVQQKQQIMKEVSKSKEEKRQLLEKLEQQEKQQKQKQRKQEDLFQKLKEADSQIMQGKASQQQQREKEKQLIQVQIQKDELEQQKRRAQNELQNAEVDFNQWQDIHKDIKEDIKSLDNKNNILINKLKQIKTEKDEIHDIKMREKEDLLDENRSMTNELKLIDVIIKNFIIPDEVNKLQSRLNYNELDDEWEIIQKKVQHSLAENPGSALNLKYPLCEASRMAINFGDENPRYRHDNILSLDLDLPDRTTEQDEAKVEQIINIALNDKDDDVENNSTMPNVYIEDPSSIKQKEEILNQSKVPRIPSSKRPKTGVKKY